MANEYVGFKSKNPQATVSIEGGQIILSNLWEDDTFKCKYDEGTDLSALEGVSLPSNLSAIHHRDKQFIEFIWGPVDKSHALLKRKFEFIFLQKSFVAEFTYASEVLKILA